MACNRAQQQRAITGSPRLQSGKCHSLLRGNKLVGKPASSAACTQLCANVHALLKSCLFFCIQKQLGWGSTPLLKHTL